MAPSHFEPRRRVRRFALARPQHYNSGSSAYLEREPTMLTPAVHTLVEALTRDFAADIQGPNAKRLLEEYVTKHDDWRDYAIFRPDGGMYARNLIAKNEMFELLCLCWGPGQTSPVHNHEGQNCWMAVLDGPMEEAHFAFPEPEAEGPLEAGALKSFSPGDVAFIRDEIGLHLVRAAQAKPAYSLHLYSRPYDECNCYCEETGRVTRAPLTFHTVRGERAAD